MRSRAVVTTAALAVSIVACRTPRDGTSEARSNVLLITIDTLRADHVGCYGDTHASTPAIDALCAEGVRFDPALASVPLTLHRTPAC